MVRRGRSVWELCRRLAHATAGGAHFQRGHAALHALGIGAPASGQPGVAPVVAMIENHGEIFMVIFVMCRRT
jgi:hypothetical protein